MNSDQITNVSERGQYQGCIAIDLGTTNSVIGYIDKDEKEVDVLNADGDLLTPSFIWFKIDPTFKTVKPLVGKRAKELMKSDPTNVVSSYKTKMGLTKGENVVKSIPGIGDVTAEICSAYALTYLKQSAEKYLNESITRALITVPARFTEAQRYSTKLSASRAGLDVIRLLDEPSAAAFYYLYKDVDLIDARKLGEDGHENKTVLVYDLGGGTFDVSLITISGINCSQVATSGDTHLGGDNFDEEIARWIASQLQINYNMLGRNDREKIIRLAEQAKIDISNNYYANPNRTAPAVVNLDTIKDLFDTSITNETNTIVLRKDTCFKMLDRYIESTMQYVMKILDDSKATVADLDEILLVGGSSRFPLIRQKMVQYLNDERFDLDYFSKTLVDPDKAVCYGARKYMKAVLDGSGERLKTRIPNPVGVVLVNDRGMDEFNTVLSSDTILPTIRPKKLRKAVTNVVKGCKELIFDVQEGYSKDPEDNLTLGKIRIPLSDEVSENPGTASFYIQMSVDQNALISVSIKDNTPGSTGEVITKVFTHDDTGSGIEVTPEEDVDTKPTKSIKIPRRRQRVKQPQPTENNTSSTDVTGSLGALDFGE